MTARKKASVAGARRVTANLDNLATLFQTYGGSLGIPSRVAADFAYRCDLLSDAIERHVGASKQARFNPAEIGEEVPGPLEALDSDEPWMDGHFTQEKFNALEGKQESGELAANAAAHKADPKLAALIQKAADLAAARATRAILAKKAEEEVEETEEEVIEETPSKKAKKADPEMTSEETKEEAEKTAALYGLFSAR
jgi:hypothetical protein